MRLPRLRFTVRRLMVAVAIVAVAVAVAITAEMMRKRARYRYLSNRYGAMGDCFHIPIGPNRGGILDWNNKGEEIDSITYAQRKSFYDAMSLKYLIASRHPWLLVPPDPPKSK